MRFFTRPGLRWLPALLMMAAIFAFSSIPSNAMPRFGWMDLLVKKGGHALGYALLALAYRHGLGEKGGGRAGWLAWGLAAVYAASDEFHQSFVPGRNAALEDVLVDAAGAGLAMAVWNYRSKVKSRRSGTEG